MPGESEAELAEEEAALECTWSLTSLYFMRGGSIIFSCLKAKLSLTRDLSDRGQEHGRHCHCKTKMPHEQPDESVGGVQVDSPEGATIGNASLADPSQKRLDRVRWRTCSVKLLISHASPLTQINLDDFHCAPGIYDSRNPFCH